MSIMDSENQQYGRLGGEKRLILRGRKIFSYHQVFESDSDSEDENLMDYETIFERIETERRERLVELQRHVENNRKSNGCPKQESESFSSFNIFEDRVPTPNFSASIIETSWTDSTGFPDASAGDIGSVHMTHSHKLVADIGDKHISCHREELLELPNWNEQPCTIDAQLFENIDQSTLGKNRSNMRDAESQYDQHVISPLMKSMIEPMEISSVSTPVGNTDTTIPTKQQDGSVILSSENQSSNQANQIFDENIGTIVEEQVVAKSQRNDDSDCSVNSNSTYVAGNLNSTYVLEKQQNGSATSVSAQTLSTSFCLRNQNFPELKIELDGTLLLEKTAPEEETLGRFGTPTGRQLVAEKPQSYRTPVRGSSLRSVTPRYFSPTTSSSMKAVGNKVGNSNSDSCAKLQICSRFVNHISRDCVTQQKSNEKCSFLSSQASPHVKNNSFRTQTCKSVLLHRSPVRNQSGTPISSVTRHHFRSPISALILKPSSALKRIAQYSPAPSMRAIDIEETKVSPVDGKHINNEINLTLNQSTVEAAVENQSTCTVQAQSSPSETMSNNYQIPLSRSAFEHLKSGGTPMPKLHTLRELQDGILSPRTPVGNVDLDSVLVSGASKSGPAPRKPLRRRKFISRAPAIGNLRFDDSNENAENTHSSVTYADKKNDEATSKNITQPQFDEKQDETLHVMIDSEHDWSEVEQLSHVAEQLTISECESLEPEMAIASTLSNAQSPIYDIDTTVREPDGQRILKVLDESSLSVNTPGRESHAHDDEMSESSCRPVHIVAAAKTAAKTKSATLVKRKIVHPEMNVSGLRRSARNRMAPARYWLGEKPIYEHDESGSLELVGVSDVMINDISSALKNASGTTIEQQLWQQKTHKRPVKSKKENMSRK